MAARTAPVLVERLPERTRRLLILVSLCLTSTMLLVAISSVSIALPSIQSDLGVGDAEAAWVVSAYAIALGGFVLVGGRAGDLLGRRRVYLAGVLLFAAGAAACGLVDSLWALTATRALQGLGAALALPTALAILAATFSGGARNRALSLWAGSGSVGAALGFVVGGLATELLGWRWIFFLTLPVAAVILVATPLVLPESRPAERPASVDLAGAVTVTAGLVSFIFGLTSAEGHGWGSARVLGSFAVAVILLGVFVAIERGVPEPLLPLSALRRGSLLTAALLIQAQSMLYISIVLLTSLYLQRVLGFSPLQTGLCFVAQNLAAVAGATLAPGLVARLGPTRTMAIGLSLLAAAALWLGRAHPQGSFWQDALPGIVLLGLGASTGFVSANALAFAGMGPRDVGLASGVMNTFQQVGAAIGVALLTSIAASRTATLLREGTPRVEAIASGLGLGWHAGAGIALCGAAAALFAGRRRRARVAPERW